jgi:hypothetical membrane protein
MRRLAGVVGPAAFVGAWVIGSVLRRSDGYSVVSDPISRLAEVGSSTKPLMTAGFVTFGVAVPAFALADRRALGAPATAALVLAGLGTLGVAAAPLHPVDDVPMHAVAAIAGYAGLAAAPILATTQRNVALGMLSAACLAATALGPAHGLLQRVGLTVVDAWIVRRALSERRGERS